MNNSIQSISTNKPSPAKPEQDQVLPAAMQMHTALPVLQPAKAEKAVEQKPKFDPQKFQQELKDIVERLNAQMKDSKRELGFSMDDEINTFVVTVRNTNTGEVIRQIPTEVVVNFAHSIEDLKGVLFNQKM